MWIRDSYRGGVQLARSLAGGGFPVFRFDQSGLGDSPLSPRPCAELRQAELQAAMDLVARRTGAQRFVVGGICSAADQGFQFAAIEPRIHGVLPVSYTHLDVYKRQPMWCRKRARHQPTVNCVGT